MTDAFWDERFASEEYVYGTEPNAFLVEQARLLTPKGNILVPADGEGRNGVWLAGQGMNVLSVDSSEVGMAKARRLADSRGVPIATEVADLTRWDWPVGRFDAVISLFLHLRPKERPGIHAKYAAALKPGGLVILEAFRKEQLALESGGPREPELLYDVESLRADFPAMEILLLENAMKDLSEGSLHRGQGATVRLVARKR